ncbi:MAG: hypothetical protein E7284_03625 [Lachnospiraceae bacterium]|nr:hypothetical protein [Lachnospiraceae bacterium]
MNRFFRICFLCVAGAICFVAGMWFSTYLFVKNQNEIREKINIQQEMSEEIASDVPQMLETAAVPTIDMNTEYVVIKENTITGETIESIEEIPQQFSGMSREELEEYFKEYEKCPVLDDREDGFVSATVESYSANRVVIKKVYEPIELEERFYLRAEENYVVIYYSDNSTVYMYTNISMNVLPEETRKEIEEGKEIESYESLYSFLESYTS